MNRGLNKVMLIGWIDGSIELRHTASGRPVASFTVATPRTWLSAEGGRHEETEWFNVVAWGSLAEICKERLVSNQQLYLEGRLQTRSWEDESGKVHFRTEVVAQEVVALDSQSEMFG